MAGRLLLLLWLLCWWAADAVRADPPKPDVQRGLASSEWPLETVRLKNGTSYAGLIQSETDSELEIAEIHRPPGKPMFAVIRPIDAADVEHIERLDGQARRQLQLRFERFRQRARIEAGQIENVELQQIADGRMSFRYRGPWFDLTSTCDEEMTRRSIVRIEQIFRAYRQVLPPRAERKSNLQFLLFGTIDGYRSHLEEQGLNIDNQAFYSARQNLVVAGSDLNVFARRLTAAREKHERLRRQYEQLDQEFVTRSQALIERLQEAGYSQAEIQQEMRLRKALWQRQRDQTLTEINRLDRQNDEQFAEVTAAMFRRLYHEAFHAYLENYLYPGESLEVPRWLNEGLAQVFETARLDAETLRIDAPDPLRLEKLQRELAGDERLALPDILQADENTFFAAHARPASSRHYLYCWAIAYYLAFETDGLRLDALDQYVANERNFGPTTRFTALVQMPLDKFDRMWRDRMMTLETSRNGTE